MSDDKEFEKKLAEVFENIRASEKEMDDLNETELKTARKTIKEIRESKNLFLNEWINTDFKRYGRLTKHDLMRVFIGYRIANLMEDLQGKLQGGENS